MRYAVMMNNLLDVLCADLAAEGDDVLALLEALDEPAWSTPTGCAGWDLRDQVSHLAWNDDAAVLAVTEPGRFRRGRHDSPDAVQAMVDGVITDNHHRSGTDLLGWFRTARRGLLDAVAGRDPKLRVPWYGPDMSLASMVTARFMETWAHGLDIAEAMDQPRGATDRVRHVVFLGLQALPNSFAANGRPIPDRPVRVEVRAPSGVLWCFGPEGAADVVRGEAQDLALVVTQRRHLDDADLQAEGPVAGEWLAIAQAFAGPPGTGRARAGLPLSTGPAEGEEG